jgi:hypothetical protein
VGEAHWLVAQERGGVMVFGLACQAIDHGVGDGSRRFLDVVLVLRYVRG